MPELPADKPEVVVESREIAREDAEQMVAAIEKAAKSFSDLGFSDRGYRVGPPLTVKPSTEGEQGYAFRVSSGYDDEGTRREGDDSTHSTMYVWRTAPDGVVTDRHTYLFFGTSRSEAGKEVTAELYLQDGDRNRGGKTRLVGEVSCDKKGCNSTEGELIQTKVNDLVVTLLQPELDRLTAEKEARLAEKARVIDEAKRAEAARKAEEKSAPATKVKEF